MREWITKVEIIDILESQKKPDFNNNFVLELELDKKEKVIYTLNDKEKELFKQGFWPEQIMKIDNVGWRATYIINYWKH